jgi:hypothetical protein
VLAALCEGSSTGFLAVSHTDDTSFGAARPAPTGNDGQTAISGGTIYLASGPIGGSGNLHSEVLASNNDGENWQGQLEAAKTLPAVGEDNIALTANRNAPAAFAATATSLWVLTARTAGPRSRSGRPDVSRRPRGDHRQGDDHSPSCAPNR